MSDIIALIATAVAALAAGRLTAWPTIRRLRDRFADAIWHTEHDPLTGLLNRTGLVAAHTARPAGGSLIAVLLDLDDFKTVNDTYGHDAGDQLLTIVGARIADAARLYGGAAARLSGDEFAVLMPAPDREVDRPVEMVAAYASMAVTVTVDGGPVTLAPRASAGACRAGRDEPLPVLLRHADVALYHAKRGGGGTHVFYRPGLTMPTPGGRRGTRLRDRHASEATA